MKLLALLILPVLFATPMAYADSTIRDTIDIIEGQKDISAPTENARDDLDRWVEDFYRKENVQERAQRKEPHDASAVAKEVDDILYEDMLYKLRQDEAKPATPKLEEPAGRAHDCEGDRTERWIEHLIQSQKEKQRK